MAEPKVLQHRLFSCQLCVPSDWTDEQVVELAEKEYPAGTENGWHVRKQADYDAAKMPDKERVPCNDNEGFIHIVVTV